MQNQNVVILGETLTLLPERAAYWSRQETLFISDLHFGKAADFRSQGFPIPHGTTNEALLRLSNLISTLSPKRIIILGDLIHSSNGRTEKVSNEFKEWRINFKEIEIILVRGNHDRRAGDPPPTWSIDCVPEPYVVAPFICAHNFTETPSAFGIQGHIHPKFFVGKRGQNGKLFPCFVLEPNLLILPSFGSFTGGFKIPPAPKKIFYPIIENQVYEVKREEF